MQRVSTFACKHVNVLLRVASHGTAPAVQSWLLLILFWFDVKLPAGSFIQSQAVKYTIWTVGQRFMLAEVIRPESKVLVTSKNGATDSFVYR
eukprot:5309404-Pleurochrysis_carterae.AAC.1